MSPIYLVQCFHLNRITAVCLNYMNDFFLSDWAEEVFIPVEVLNNITLWLVQHQTPEGEFLETSEFIYNRYFHVRISWEGIQKNCELCEKFLQFGMMV